MDRHNSCAVSTFPSSRAVSVCFITVRTVALRCRLRVRFVLSARTCFFADRRFKTNTPFANFSPNSLEDNRDINCLLQYVYLMIPQNIGFVHIFSEILRCLVAAIVLFLNSALSSVDAIS